MKFAVGDNIKVFDHKNNGWWYFTMYKETKLYYIFIDLGDEGSRKIRILKQSKETK